MNQQHNHHTKAEPPLPSTNGGTSGRTIVDNNSEGFPSPTMGDGCGNDAGEMRRSRSSVSSSSSGSGSSTTGDAGGSTIDDDAATPPAFHSASILGGASGTLTLPSALSMTSSMMTSSLMTSSATSAFGGNGPGPLSYGSSPFATMAAAMNAAQHLCATNAAAAAFAFRPPSADGATAVSAAAAAAAAVDAVGPLRNFQCKLCLSMFDSKPDLQIHTQGHMREAKPYKCSHCPKNFANSSYLSQHMRIHLGIKPFGPCQYCGRKFTQLSHLQQHLRTHTGDKPYRCRFPACEKAFSQLSNLQSHSRCHQSDKPFKCNSCYKCFTDEQSLLEHIPKHKESKHLKIHICQFCGKSYTQATYLAKHMTKHSDRGSGGVHSMGKGGSHHGPKHGSHAGGSNHGNNVTNNHNTTTNNNSHTTSNNASTINNINNTVNSIIDEQLNWAQHRDNAFNINGAEGCGTAELNSVNALPFNLFSDPLQAHNHHMLQSQSAAYAAASPNGDPSAFTRLAGLAAPLSSRLAAARNPYAFPYDNLKPPGHAAVLGHHG